MNIDFKAEPYGKCTFHIGDTHPYQKSRYKQWVPKIDVHILYNFFLMMKISKFFNGYFSFSFLQKNHCDYSSIEKYLKTDLFVQKQQMNTLVCL